MTAGYPDELQAPACECGQWRPHGRRLETMSVTEYEIARRAFEQIRAAFPNLVMELDPTPVHFELSMTIPAQPGLLFDVDLNLQNVDELHLNAADLWVEWFPCADTAVVES